MNRATRVAGISVGLATAAAVLAFRPPHAASLSTTDPARLKAVEDYLAGARDEIGFPGLALVIVQGDQVVHKTTLGNADDSGRPVTAQTPFHLASLTKAFTATAVIQLVEAGRLDLDAPVQRYLPWFTVADGAAAARITIRTLLNQTSGFPTRVGRSYVGTDDQDAGALERGVRELAATDLASEPGKSFQYSNANYDVLALVVQVVSGMPFDQYLDQRIYAPLSMTHSHATTAAARADGLAAGYLPWYGVLWRQTSVGIPRTANGSAATFASVEDLGHWLIANLNGGRYGTASVVSPTGMTLLHTPAASEDDFHSYAMGWQVRPLWEVLDPNKPDASAAADAYLLPTLIEHGGSWANAHTYIGFVPAQRWGVALLVNGNYEADESRLAILEQNVLRLLAGHETQAWVARAGILAQYGPPIAIGLLLAELGSLAWSVRTLARLGRASRRQPRPRRVIVGGLVALGLDAFVMWLLLVQVPGQFDSDLPVILRTAPDAAMLIVPAFVLAALWGPLRTALLVLAGFRRSREPSVEPTIGPPPPPQDLAGLTPGDV